MYFKCLGLIQETVSLRSVSCSRLPRRARVNSFLRLGLRAVGGGNKVFLCVDTGRSGGIVGLFCLSRIRFRQLSLGGMLPGVKKL
uniref:Ribosomal protein S14 n=1 Tax=Lotharella oceanica TaxID=641309 RepID=A0A140GYR5_9EUKA|nr:ribosomal protein S14 [Lotharella oceanica]AMN87087.1 ribosomal protein S14 [Lotharella oceanica]